MVKVNLRKKSKTQEKKTACFTIDCSLPVEDNVIIVKDFVDYLTARIKVEGKTGNLGDSVNVSADGTNVSVVANIAFSKRYLKYLTKKYLKKQELREYLRVVASKKDAYQLKYFSMDNEENEDE
jgi:large subunit ribosomal protein L22e